MKRIHEYKRQFMNAISIIARYKAIKEMSPEERAKVRRGAPWEPWQRWGSAGRGLDALRSGQRSLPGAAARSRPPPLAPDR